MHKLNLTLLRCSVSQVWMACSMSTITQRDLATRLVCWIYPSLLASKDHWWTPENGLAGSKAVCVLLLKGFLQPLTPNIIAWFLSYRFSYNQPTRMMLLLQILAASVVSILQWPPYWQKLRLPSLRVSLLRWSPSWRKTNDCFCCKSLRLLSWAFCGDRLTVTNCN